MSFIQAGELRKRFLTEGLFYKLDVEGMEYESRALAKITRRGAVCEEADAVVIMVNPGSCEPADASHVYPLYQEDLFALPFVKVKEDMTQYQLMRLMERMEWNMMYIINLSDLRAGNINEYRRMRERLNRAGQGGHSIFSEGRGETIHQFVADRTRVIAAWGTNEFIREDALKAYNYLTNFFTIEGLPHQDFPFYRHPNPMLKDRCIQWLGDMCEMLGDQVMV